MPARSTRLTVAAVCATAAALALPLAVAPAAGAASGIPPIVVTEIVGDNVGYDDYEYVEVLNTTTAPIDLAAAGYSFAYTNTDSADRSWDKPLTAEPLVLAGGEAAVLWVSYSATNVDAFARSVDDFRAHHSVAPETQVVRVTGQAGIANGGERGVRVLKDGEISAWSYVPSGALGTDQAAHFRLPADAADPGLDLLAQKAPRTPGVVAPEALVRPTPQPEPTATGGPTPTGAPTGGPIEETPDAAAWPLVVTEIAPDNTGADDYEFFEVRNTTTEPVDLAAEGYAFAYAYPNSTPDVALTIAEPTVIKAGETVVFWVSYTASGLDSFARTVDEFRAAWSAPADTRVVRVTGQPGMANGAPRGIRVLKDGETSSLSMYGRSSAAPHQSAHFRIPENPATTAMSILSEPSAPSPGVVAPEALTAPPFDPQPDPSVVTAPLQVTEVLVDSTNVGGADGYEFIEVYNATASPIDFSDYSLTYLYPDTGSEVLWPAVPGDVVIAGGESLVFWIKNGGNGALGADDFNAHFGTDLVGGRDLVEIFSAGMANGSGRGIEVATNTGYTVSRAYYNVTANPDGTLRDDVHLDQGIRYAARDGEPAAQDIVDWTAATPGAVQRDQAPAGLMVVPADTAPPVITDRTAAQITPGEDFAVSVAVADDVQARTVTLTLANNVDEDPLTVALTDAGDGLFTHVINAADLVGKRWYEFGVTASDGTNAATLGTRRVAVAGIDTSPVRLNVTDGQFVAGETAVIAGGDLYPSEVEVSVDGGVVETTPSLEGQPTFVFETSNVNYYFKNGVRVGGTPTGDILNIFELGTTGWETIVTPVPLEYIAQGDELVLSVWAGSKKAPEIDHRENNDNFDIRGLRLVLPDGRTLTPEGYDDPARVLAMGDNDANPEANTLFDVYDARFTLPDDAFAANAYAWDTTAREDGTAAVSATDGTVTLDRDVVVDNTAPVVTSTVKDVYQGTIDLSATITDAGSGVASSTATFDGAPIAEWAPNPETGRYEYSTSSVDLAAGEHTVEVTATDVLGNTDTWSATFETYEEQPSAGALAPVEGAEVRAGEVTLQAKVEDPTGDVLDVSFLEGRRVDLADGDIEVRSGTVNDAQSLERAASEPLSDAQVRTLAAVDGVSDDVTSDAEFPYQLFDVAVPADEAGAQVRATWSGRANAGATVALYAQRADASGWDEVDRHVALADDEAFTLDAVVDAGAYALADDRVVRLLVQHSEGFAGEALSTRDTAVTPHNPADVARSEYDFTFAWESDTQYYNEDTMPGDPYAHQQAIHQYLVDRREALNLQYLFHTGDIIDDYDQMYQWENAKVEYDKLDAAGLPYGVLAGNHDVGNHLEDYTNYGTYFGDARFAGTPWFGESFENNRGHYDLISAGGVDFLMLYTGWLPNDASIAWMNDVLAQYPDRVAIIAQHEFILTTGGLGAIPQRVLDEVVAPNPNVRMVFSGHYHDAFTREDAFDDTGDGVPDRTVYSMLFDYQGLPEGGLGYLRLLHFDNEGERMMVRTYSPSLDDYNSDDPSLADAPQEFELTYAQLGIEPGVRTLGTDAFSAEILTANEIAAFEGVASGSVLTATWPLAETGERGWYVRSSDPYGAVDYSPVTLFSVLPALPEPEPEPEPETPGTGGPGTGGPGVGGPGVGDGVGIGAGSGSAPDAGTLPATGADAAATAPWIYGAGALIVMGVGAVLLNGRRRAGMRKS